MKTLTNLRNKCTPNWEVRPVLIFGVLLLLLFFTACSKDEPTPEDPAIAEAAKLKAFNTEVTALPDFLNPTIVDPPEEISSEPAAELGNYLCSTKTYKAAPEYNEMLLLDPTTSVIYPGALIKGESIATGEYIPIVASRKPISISVSLQNIAGSPSRTVEDPKLSSVRDAINDILRAEVTGATASKLSFEISNVYSKRQLQVSLGANYSNATVDVGGSFDFSSEKVESKLVVKYVQSYYTIDMDAIENPSDLFTDLPDVASLGSTLPSYISTVTYGRMILFTATSSYSNTEMNAAFSAAFESGVSSGDLQIEASYKNIINNSSIKAFVLGGSGAEAVKAVTGIEGVKSFILSGGNYSKDSPGAPLSYTLRNISDNAISNIVLATEYNVRQCDKIRSSFTMTLTNLDCSGVTGEGSTPQMFGSISLNEANDLDDNWFIPCAALGATIDGGDFWNHTESDYQTASNYNLNINKSTTFTLETGADNYVYLTGHIYEDDSGFTSTDDDLGTACKKLYLADLLSGSVSLNFNGDGDSATANFTIAPND